jgi:hypothetical protein
MSLLGVGLSYGVMHLILGYTNNPFEVDARAKASEVRAQMDKQEATHADAGNNINRAALRTFRMYFCRSRERRFCKAQGAR